MTLSLVKACLLLVRIVVILFYFSSSHFPPYTRGDDGVIDIDVGLVGCIEHSRGKLELMGS